MYYIIFTNTNHHNTVIFHSHQLSNQVHSLGWGDNSPRSFRRPWRDEGSQVCRQTLTSLFLVYELPSAHRNIQAQNWPAHLYPLQSWHRKTRVWVRGLQVGCWYNLINNLHNYQAFLFSFYSPPPSTTRVYIFRNLEVQENLRVTDVQLPVRFFANPLFKRWLLQWRWSNQFSFGV